MKKKQKRQRKLRKCERGIRTSKMIMPVPHIRRQALQDALRRVIPAKWWGAP